MTLTFEGYRDGEGEGDRRTDQFFLTTSGNFVTRSFEGDGDVDKDRDRQKPGLILLLGMGMGTGTGTGMGTGTRTGTRTDRNL